MGGNYYVLCSRGKEQAFIYIQFYYSTLTLQENKSSLALLSVVIKKFFYFIQQSMCSRNNIIQLLNQGPSSLNNFFDGSRHVGGLGGDGGWIGFGNGILWFRSNGLVIERSERCPARWVIQLRFSPFQNTFITKDVAACKSRFCLVCAKANGALSIIKV